MTSVSFVEVTTLSENIPQNSIPCSMQLMNVITSNVLLKVTCELKTTTVKGIITGNSEQLNQNKQRKYCFLVLCCFMWSFFPFTSGLLELKQSFYKQTKRCKHDVSFGNCLCISSTSNSSD